MKLRSLLSRLHARVGDLWWYSAMIFLACRSGDAIQAFIGLWLVPKYVGPQELGAVLPLQQLTSFLTVPLAVVAVVFSKYVNTYATRGEYGKVKSFIHDVFTASFILFVICIAGAYLIMPFFYERLRIASGSLTLLILICGLVGNLGTIISSAQQGLKRFKTMSAMALLSAPIRLLTLLIAMPIRALSGYILGQTTPATATSLLSVIDVHRALKTYTPDKSWRKDIPEIWRYLWPMAIYMSLTTFSTSVISTVYRQRLPEIESAAFYMLSRFSEVAGYLGASAIVVLFPLASEAHERDSATNPLLLRSIAASLIPAVFLSIVFAFISKSLFSLAPTWATFTQYANLLPIMTITAGLAAVVNAIFTYEMACRRFQVAAWLILSNFTWMFLLVSFTGHEFFRGIISDQFVDLIKRADIAHLSTLTYAGFAFIGLQAFASFIISRRLSK